MNPETPYKLSDQEMEICHQLISKTETAFADPRQSGYFVKTAGVTENGDIVTGGNKENSLSDAFVHGETAVISRIRDQYGEVAIKAIGFYQEGDVSEENISPCGACRDVLIQQTSPELLLMSGNKNKIVVLKLRDFIFEDFHEIMPTDLDSIGVKQAIIALNKGIDEYLPKNLKRKVYGVSIIDQNGKNYRGSLYTNAGYDAITPGLAAVQTWVNSDVNKRCNIDKIVIVSKSEIPSPFYRDRQALLELAEVTYQKKVRVELIQLDNSDNILKVATTDTNEWLPRPFSALSFGMHDLIQSQHNKMFAKLSI